MTVAFLRGDARDLPFPDQSFRMAFFAPPWDNLAVFDEAIPEIRRVLHPKGKMLFLLPHVEARRTAATLCITNRDWTERQEVAAPYPGQVVSGASYFAVDPAWAQSVIAGFSAETVIDPMCGTGTIPRAAGRLGRDAVGVDIGWGD